MERIYYARGVGTVFTHMQNAKLKFLGIVKLLMNSPEKSARILKYHL